MQDNATPPPSGPTPPPASGPTSRSPSGSGAAPGLSTAQITPPGTLYADPPDPRLHLLLAGCYGVLVWHLPPLGLTVVAAGLAGLFAATPLRRRLLPGMLRGHAWFVLVWVMLRFALACLGPAETSSVPVIGNNGGAGASGVFDALRLAWPDGPLWRTLHGNLPYWGRGWPCSSASALRWPWPPRPAHWGWRWCGCCAPCWAREPGSPRWAWP